MVYIEVPFKPIEQKKNGKITVELKQNLIELKIFALKQIFVLIFWTI